METIVIIPPRVDMTPDIGKTLSVPSVPTVLATLTKIAETPVAPDALGLSVPTVPTVTPSTTVATFTDAGAVTISQASPGVVTLNGHGLSANREIFFKSDGTLPTGLTQYTHYFVKTVNDENTFTVSATTGGTAINTTSAGSGTHNLWTKNA